MMCDNRLISGLNMIATGKRISQLIDSSGLTDKELAGILGLSVQSINKWRHGYNLPDTENLYMLSRILGVKVDDFFVPQIHIEYVSDNFEILLFRRLQSYYLRLSNGDM